MLRYDLTTCFGKDGEISSPNYRPTDMTYCERRRMGAYHSVAQCEGRTPITQSLGYPLPDPTRRCDDGGSRNSRTLLCARTSSPLLALQGSETAGRYRAVVLRVARADGRLRSPAVRGVARVLVLFFAERRSRSLLGSRGRSLMGNLQYDTIITV